MEHACQLPGQEVAEGRSQPTLCVPRPGLERKVAMGRRPRSQPAFTGACQAELTLSSILCEACCPLPVHTIVIYWPWAACRDDRLARDGPGAARIIWPLTGRCRPSRSLCVTGAE